MKAQRTWSKTTELGGLQQSVIAETWRCLEGGEVIAHFNVEVKTGKSLNVLALKGTSLQEIREYAQFLKAAASRIYGSERRNVIESCPCCDHDSDSARVVFEAFDVQYKQCSSCSHVYIPAQPAPGVLAEVFADSDEHSSTYTESATLEVRLEQVIKPKLDWLMENYIRRHRRSPISLLDVGAGGGHFVEGCRRAGLPAAGYELSRSSRQFARDNFGLELLDADFLSSKTALGEFDVITFWGLLEYVTDPKSFLREAHGRLSKSAGMIVVEVPRFDCISTAIQREYPSTIARHLDPTSHVNCFTDASLATALLSCGFEVIGAWYFGMDAYELLVQLSLQSDDGDLLSRFAHLIPALQASMDAVRLCDDIVVAAVPTT